MAERARLQDQLRSIERQAYDLETSYLQESVQCGSVLQGFEAYLSSTRRTTILRRSKRVPLKDRLFSLSSATSPAAEEQQQATRLDGRSPLGPVRPKFGGFDASGRGNLKKGGRILQREGKKLRAFNQQDLDGGDD